MLLWQVLAVLGLTAFAYAALMGVARRQRYMALVMRTDMNGRGLVTVLDSDIDMLNRTRRARRSFVHGALALLMRDFMALAQGASLRVHVMLVIPIAATFAWIWLKALLVPDPEDLRSLVALQGLTLSFSSGRNA